MRAMLGQIADFDDSDSSSEASLEEPLQEETQETTVANTADDMKSFLNAEIEKKRKLRATATGSYQKSAKTSK